MAVSINLPAILAPLAGGARFIELEGATVGNAVQALTARYPALTPRIVDEAGGQYPFVAIYLNDDDIRFLSGFETAIKDGDELSIVPAVAGG